MNISDYFIEEEEEDEPQQKKIYNCWIKYGKKKEPSLWKCPTCKSPPSDLVALDGGSRPCSNVKCDTHFHWCALTEREEEGPPLHEED